jgi:hypothetical protein
MRPILALAKSEADHWAQARDLLLENRPTSVVVAECS